MSIVLLLDDERTFKDDRKYVLARTVDEAIAAVAGLNYIDELWLDYVLVRDDSTSFLRALAKRHADGDTLKIGKVYFHSSAYMAYSLVVAYAEDAGITEVERVSDFDRHHLFNN